MWLLNNHTLFLTALVLTVFPQKAKTNLKCVSPCTNEKNTLNYSYCYTNAKYSEWEYCVQSNSKGTDTKQINVSQTGLINVGSSNLKEGDARFTI